MSEKFTPGPWVIDPNGLSYTVNDCAGRHVAMVSCFKSIVGDDIQNIANAHLIAAAPDLYEAVKKMCNNALDLGYCHATDCGHCKSMAAIKKALGEV